MRYFICAHCKKPVRDYMAVWAGKSSLRRYYHAPCLRTEKFYKEWAAKKLKTEGSK